MNVLVTGGCGFIGANLIRLLVDDAGCNVTVLDNLSKGSLDNIKDVAIHRFIESDITQYNGFLQDVDGVDAIIHLAAFGSVVESIVTPEENFNVNVLGTFNVLRAAAKHGVKKIVFASTGGALIGNATPPVNESSTPLPISPYGASKLACEGYCSAFSNSYDIDITSLRFANVIGPFSGHKKGAVTQFFKAIHNNDPIEIYGDGSASRDFLHVRDLCDGIRLALNSDNKGYNVYHLASGNETSVNDLALKIIDAAGKNDHPIIYHDKRKGEVDRNFATFDRAKRKLGFEPKFTLDEALVDTWKWFKENVFDHE